MAWYNTVEFYVVAGSLAAAVVALSALPSRRGAAVLHMAAGQLTAGSPDDRPELEVSVDSRRRLHIVRRGLQGITDAGAASLALNLTGFDAAIEERLTPARGGEPCHTAEFIFDCFGPERYHFSYNSETTGLFAAFTLPLREGIRTTRPLREM